MAPAKKNGMGISKAIGRTAAIAGMVELRGARKGRLGRLVLLVVAASASLGMLGTAASAAAPGNPGVPGSPTTIFEEGFENVPNPPQPGPPVVNGSYQFISNYTGTGPLAMTYTAAPSWISLGQCNGMVLSFNTNNPAGSCGAGGFDALRGLAQALGGFDPPPNGANFNHALSAWTLNQSVATTPAATLQTASNIPLTSANRFITFSVDVGVTSCGAPFDPLLRFFLTDGGSEIGVTDAAIDVCADPRGNPPPGAATRTGSYASDDSILTSASSVGFKLTNDQGQSNGNDYAYDNVRMLDATPQLDKEFVPGTITLGGQTTLRFTITNTDDLAAKRGWSFTDTLASGLKVASEDVETDCPSAAVDLELDGDTIDVEGDLDAGMESCTVEVKVTTTEVGTHENSEGNVSDLVGLDPPGEAELECTATNPPVGNLEGPFVDCPFSDEPPANDFTIQQDWESGDDDVASYQTPVVGDLYGTGKPATVVGSNRDITGGSVFSGRLANDLKVYDGATGDLLHTITTPRYSWTSHSVATIADVNEDGRGEIIFRAASHSQRQVDADAAGVPTANDVVGRLIAYTYDPVGDDWEVMWVSNERFDHGETLNTSTGTRTGFGVSVADFNGDGAAEIYVGNEVFNALTGVRLAAGDDTDPSGCQFQGPGCYNGQTAAVDMDDDGQLELVAGEAVYKLQINNPNGEAGNDISIWRRADEDNSNVRDGFTAVADMDLDGDPDVVTSGRLGGETSATVLYVWDGQTDEILGMRTGTQMVGSNGSRGGAPLIGDIDGDERPEIVVVTTSRLRAFGLVPGEGTLADALNEEWTLGTNDGSGATSLSMFDFNSDGRQELVYRDQSNLRIVDGGPDPTNTNRNLATFACSSGTGTEMPVVADIDGSLQARILIACGNDLRAYETASFAWANTRPVWNQQAYFVAHINDDLTVPASQFEHWTVFSDPEHRCSDGANRPLNSFQQQVTDLDSETGCPVICVPPSLQVDKTSDPASGAIVQPGDTIAYTVAIENTSSDDVTDVDLTDDLSNVLDDATITSGPAVDPPGAGTAQITGNELAFNGTIPQGETVTITYEATVKPRSELGDRMLGNSVIGEFSNCNGTTGQLRCKTGHPVVVPRTDLELEKTGDAVVDPGDPVSYTLMLTNHGPDPSTGATVTDELPAGLTNVQVPQDCELQGSTLTCDVGPLGVDESTEIEITADAPNTPATCFENEALVEADGDDDDGSNDEASFRTCTTPVADLQLTKETNPAVVDPGEQFAYFIAVTNNGPNTSSGSTVTDTLPDGVTIVAFPQDDCDVQGQTITCDVGSLIPSGQAQGFTILVEAPNTPSTCFENTASVEGDDADPAEGDPDLSNNGDTARTCTTPAADLEIEKSGPAEVEAGGQVTWTLTVTNHGPQASSGSTVTDQIPSGITNVQVPQGCDLQGQTLSCEVGELDVDESTDIEITGTAPSTGSTCFTNNASVEGDEGDPVLANNESEPVQTCARAADLELTKTVDPQVVDPGGQVTYTLTVTNHGPDDSPGPAVTDNLPAGLTNVQVPQNCQLAGSEVTCNVGGLSADQSTEIVVTGDAPNTPATCFSNDATVDGVNDPTPGNDDASARACTTPAADLELSKAAPALVDPGGQVTWTLTVTNNGPQQSSGSTVTDNLPAAITNVQAPGCDVQGSTVTCDVGPLDADQSTDIQITGDAPSDADTCFSNDASVEGSSSEGEPNPDNNDATAETCTNEGADLEVTKVADAGPHFAGDQVNYTITATNHGPAAAHNVQVSDDLPDALALVSATPGQGQCGNTDPVGCDLGTIASGDSVEIELVVTIGSDQSGNQVENTACATGQEPDPSDANDCDTEPVDVEPEADLRITKTADPRPVRAGNRLTYTLEVTNDGPSATPQATVTDKLRKQLRHVSDDAGCDVTGLPQISCDLGPLASGESTTVEIVTRVSPKAKQGKIANTAAVTGPITDPNPTNNEDSAKTKVRPLKPRLTVNKTAGKSTARPGQVLSYKITVANKGRGVARKVSVCDLLPSGQRVLRAPGAAKRSAKRVCWKLNRLAPKSKRTFKITTQVDFNADTGMQRNKAVVDGANAKPSRDGAAVKVKPASGACRARGVALRC